MSLLGLEWLDGSSPRVTSPLMLEKLISNRPTGQGEDAPQVSVIVTVLQEKYKERAH